MTNTFSGLYQQNPVKRARRETAALAAMLLLTTVLSYLAALAVSLIGPFLSSGISLVLARQFGFSASEARLILADFSASALWTQFYSMLAEFVTFLLPFAFFSKCIQNRPFDEVFPLCGGKKIGFFPALYACQMTVASAASALCNAIGGFVAPDFFASYPVEDAVGMTGAETLVYFLSLCVFTPLVEEYVFRGVIFGSLRKYGFGYAAVASALLFGLAHGGPSSLAYALTAGLIFAAAYEMTGSVKCGVLLHALNNTVSFLFGTFLPQYTDESFIETANMFFNLLVGVLAVWGFVHMLRLVNAKKRADGETLERGGSEEIHEPEPPAAQTPQVPLKAFFSLGTVFYILLFLYNMMMIYWYGY